MIKSKVLIIEDDPYLGAQVEDYLNTQGFYAKWLADERLWRKTLTDNTFDALVLDLILPHEPGEKILKEIKNLFPELPVLVLTAKHGIDSKKECFDAGADDYLVKPFEILELELRLKALLKRRTKHPTHIFRTNDVEIDLNKGIIRKKGQEITLSRRRWDLLVYLLKNHGRVIPKEEIMANVWQDANVSEDVLRSYIKDLRKILPENTLITIHGRGYRLDI